MLYSIWPLGSIEDVTQLVALSERAPDTIAHVASSNKIMQRLTMVRGFRVEVANALGMPGKTLCVSRSSVERARPDVKQAFECAGGLQE